MADSMDYYYKFLRDFDSIRSDPWPTDALRVAAHERKSHLESRMANSITESLQAHSQVIRGIVNDVTVETDSDIRMRLLRLQKMEADKKIGDSERALISQSIPQIAPAPAPAPAPAYKPEYYPTPAPTRTPAPDPPLREGRSVTRYASQQDKEWEATGIAADYSKYSATREDQIMFQQLIYNRLTGPGLMWSDADAGETYDRAMEIVKGKGEKEKR